ncbi:hypothetical protein CDL15_Pgr012547 [Punica granatum]|uniref:Uncharacterized protein n=1 Tax=Punica granatum TaxID=22663 RepID=A0A218XYK7_PUNGR|nr:hypothetical protein CDL15_Pgr012547 [Punica granatum]
MACRAGQCNEDLSGKQLTSVGTLESRKSEIEGIERKCGHPALALQGVQLQDLSFRTINGSGERPSFAKLCKGRTKDKAMTFTVKLVCEKCENVKEVPCRFKGVGRPPPATMGSAKVGVASQAFDNLG